MGAFDSQRREKKLMTRSLSPAAPWAALRRRAARLAALALVPLALAACGGDDDDDNDASADTPTRNTAYLDAKPGDVLKVRIEELNPTQAAIGYDQIYYKLGRWQGDFDRPTWAADATQQLKYINDTVGKKFGDYCEDAGADGAEKFTSIDEARAARLDDPASFHCTEAPGTHPDVMKTVVVGWDGNLYLTDGHHSFTSLREIFDGGPKLPVYVKVDANYSDLPSREAFWQRMVDENKTWLRDGDNQPITVDQLPARLGLPHDDEPGGMQEDRYRSLVYFTRDIAYDAGDLPEFAEFLWGDWLRRETTAGRMKPLSDYALAAPADTPAGDLADVLKDVVLDKSTLKESLAPDDSDTSYAAAVRDASLLMTGLADGSVVYGMTTAADLGRIQLVPDAEKDSPTDDARGELDDLARDDVKDDGTERGAGKLWFSAHYRACGKPQAGTCWGW